MDGEGDLPGLGAGGGRRRRREGGGQICFYIVMRSCTTILQQLQRKREKLLTDGHLTLADREKRKNLMLSDLLRRK